MLCTMLYTEFLMLKCLHSTQKDLQLNSKFEHVGPPDELLSVYMAICQSFAGGLVPSHLREYIQFTGRCSCFFLISLEGSLYTSSSAKWTTLTDFHLLTWSLKSKLQCPPPFWLCTCVSSHTGLFRSFRKTESVFIAVPLSCCKHLLHSTFTVCLTVQPLHFIVSVKDVCYQITLGWTVSGWVAFCYSRVASFTKVCRDFFVFSCLNFWNVISHE